MSARIATPNGEPARREVRFGLVLYGGVSLAIYIYGVVYEFWRLVRASQGRETNAYSALLNTTGKSATVDIISGASAGGINGVLLAKALATGADLSACRNLWVDRADFHKLLRDPGDRQPRSLLRTDYFDEEILSGLKEMDRLRDPRGRLVGVLDLFVPGTRLRGWLRTHLDELGQEIQTREYRKIFHLRFRRTGYNAWDPDLGYDHNDFDSSQNELVAEVARATSAFPFAFEPKLVVRRDADPRFSPEEPDAEYFSDGGILHNKPFTEAISTIFTRAADRPVDRWLLSVEPDPPRKRTEARPGPIPEVTEVVSKALFGIPRSQSMAADLDRLKQHNERASGMRELLAEIEERISDEFADLVHGGINAVLGGGDPLLGQALYVTYRGMRRKGVVDDLVERLLSAAELSESERPTVQNAVADFANSSGATLGDIDVGYAFADLIDTGLEMRRLYHLLELLDRASRELAEPEAIEYLGLAHQRLWAQFEKVQNLLWEVLGPRSETLRPMRDLRGAPAAVLRPGVAALLPAIVTALANGLTVIRGDTAEAVGYAEERLQSVLGEPVPPGLTFPLSVVAARYEVWDMFLLPIERLGGSGSRDPISFINISPEAATYIRRGADEKVAGDTLSHFGGFIKREWRDNDILWGRLDAAEVIASILLKHRRAEIEEATRKLQEEIALEEVTALKSRPAGSYREYFEREYDVGSETLADVPAQDRATLVVRGAEVFRNMLRGLASAEARGLKGRGAKAAFTLLGRALGFALFLLRWPVRAIWGRDVAIRRLATLIVLAATIWATVTIVLIATPIINNPSERLWTIIGVVYAVFLVYSLLLGIAAWVAFQARLVARTHRRLEAAQEAAATVAVDGAASPNGDA